MLHNCYCFRDRWRVEATREEVYRIMEDWAAMPRWWPSVVVRADVIDPGDANGVGGVVEMHTRGFLPYVIRTRVETLEKVFPTHLRSRTRGELWGDATWTFRADGPFVDVALDMTMIAQKPVIKYLSFALWPLFRFNHTWSMARGVEAIRLEVARRRGQNSVTSVPSTNPLSPVTSCR